MFKQLKNYIKCLGGGEVYRFITRIILWKKDIFATYQSSKPAKMRITPLGFKLRGSQSVHHLAMQRGTFDNTEKAFLQEQLKAVDVFVDIGANIGYYTCFARSLGKSVIAIEPFSKNLKYLYENIKVNNWKDIEVFPVGLSDQPGLATFYGGTSTGASLIDNWAGASRIFQRTVAVSTLDIILGNRTAGKKILIKLDVEGAEYPVLLGSKNILCSQPRPIWIVEICLAEYHPDGMNKNFKNTFDLFWENGYLAYTADQNNRLIEPHDVKRCMLQKQSDLGTINIHFIPTIN